MNLLSWNCQGLGRDSTVGELRRIVKHYHPSLLFLSETKMREEKARRFMWSLGYNGFLGVNCEGRSGGLALFWSTNTCVCLESLCKYFIDVKIKEESGLIWRATFVYGEPRTELRHIFWNRLRFLKAQWAGPWVCLGDFNEVLYVDEHLGAGARGESQMRQFPECMEDCQLVDLGFSGPKCTWNNRQQGQGNIRVRLDRAVANEPFVQLFEDIQVENIITTSSDHYAVLLTPAIAGQRRNEESFNYNFKYEAAWCRAADYKDTVERLWADGTEGLRDLQSTWSKLNGMANSLAAWSRESFGAPRKEIRKLEKRLSWLRIRSATGTYLKRRRISNADCVSCSKGKRSWLDNDLGWTGYKRGIEIHPFSRHGPQLGKEQTK
jgi:hypothetical protein